MTENSKPVKKKGTAEARYIAVSRKKFCRDSSRDTGTCNTMSNTAGMSNALKKQSMAAKLRNANRANMFRVREAHAPPAPRPSKAMETARKANGYKGTTEK